jgi:NAD(P)-dependent dehydrogenase (short-subunit alcohol dehydrogenase family)
MTQSRVAVVTGVSSGIGRSTAELLLERGFGVFGTVRATSNVGEIPPGLKVISLDVRDGESVRAGVEAVLQQAGRIDALVNNAGYTLIGALEETSVDEALALLETNFFGVLRMTQAVLPIMREQGYGRIANIGSVLGFVPGPYQGIYAASKHALEGYSESLDHEVRHFGIHISVIEPGFTRTAIVANLQQARQSIAAYAEDRNRVLQALRENAADGEDSRTAASVVLKALTSETPKLRYPAGRQARLLSRVRQFAPARLFDQGVRKQFRLSAG